jgi:hypothetical protein
MALKNSEAVLMLAIQTLLMSIFSRISKWYKFTIYQQIFISVALSQTTLKCICYEFQAKPRV